MSTKILNRQGHEVLTNDNKYGIFIAQSRDGQLMYKFHGCTLGQVKSIMGQVSQGEPYIVETKGNKNLQYTVRPYSQEAKDKIKALDLKIYIIE